MTKEEIISLVADEYAIPSEDIFGARRSQPMVEARQMAIYLIERCFEFSTLEIGKYFNRTHPTIIYSIRKIRDLLLIDTTTQRHHDNLLKRIERLI